tara:strand:- start:331 stop:600 length:270 start_codon:yes stop_codon:yes gene_type:complete
MITIIKKEKDDMTIFSRMSGNQQTLNEFLESYGIKQKWLSDRMGVCESMMSLLINNKRNWQNNQIESCARALGLRKKQLMKMVSSVEKQ